jgi:uncharacterized protein (DUF488 family)
MINLYTIGVYGYSEDEFFNALLKARIDIFVDIRRKRGVRGRQYKFANSKYLQTKLKQLNISYIHFLDLAPTTETRKVQKEMDLKTNTPKRKRVKLSQQFINSYKENSLKSFEVDKFFSDLGQDNINVILFCVERNPQACHRSLVTDFIKSKYNNINIQHIL